MTSEVDALIERLRAQEDSGRRTMGGASLSSDGTFTSWGCEPIMRARNPDGNAAADLIAAQREALEAIARGRYDGLEVSHLSAMRCRDIARRALGRGEG
jgi:hypothetical protein